MKKIIPFIMIAATGLLTTQVKADLTHRLSTSTQLSVDGAATQSSRIGSTYTVSGNNITAGTMGGLTKASGDSATTAAATQTQGVYTVTTAGSAFSLSESFVHGDAVAPIGSGVDVSSGIVADMPAYGEVVTQSGGVAGSLAGTITSAGVMTLTAGGAGTTATGQFVSEISID
mgnify:FL=1|tara:strand:+ start:125 stop:643 length:519 start_codon:yes stop_codon:yes gene_type:complete